MIARALGFPAMRFNGLFGILPIFGLYYEPVVAAVGADIEGFDVWAADKERAWGVKKN